MLLFCVMQQHRSKTLRDVGHLSVQERLECHVTSSAGQGLKVIGNIFNL